MKRKRILIGLATLLLVTLTYGIAYFHGRSIANRKAAFQVANEGAMCSLFALINKPTARAEDIYKQFLEEELEACSLKLAEACLEHPQYIQRQHYNLLQKIREHRSTPHPLIEKAIAHIEASHNMETWAWKRL